ncbi:NUDIX hydrolase [Nocardiopsis gilva YIM 90087]|uniref:NUDIX hydrolase n=1 Tax=Nocardiopsis gilva YIM 90087 TaxID=1235441 RepID=A0A223SBY0_9ACTN|nr:NUDIX hydrolase [Nocardiopsis gilva]ASU85595.1 NUDIX hydrolase [Nocardiopsis gilva YIM 90087]
MTADPTANFARPRVAAGVLFFDEHDRVLMVVPSYKDYLDIPGGYIEHGETPREAAAREVREELGIAPPIGRLLVTDWAPNPKEGDKQLFIFDGGLLTHTYLDKIQPSPDELTGYEFHDVNAIHEATIPRLARRIVHATQARTEGTTRYLEHGEHIPG